MDKTLGDWLDEEIGRAKAMAGDFGVTEAAISQWRRFGVPKKRMKAVRAYTGGVVSLEKMVPFVGAEASTGESTQEASPC